MVTGQKMIFQKEIYMFKKTFSIILVAIMLASACIPVFADVENNSPTTTTVYEQNFDNTTITDAGLVNLSSNNPVTEINNGRLEITADSSDAWIGLPTTVPTDMQTFTLTFDMCNLSLPGAGYHNGMAYRFTDSSNFARATMRANGMALINTVVNGGFKGCSDALSVVEKNMVDAGLNVGTDEIPTGITYSFKIVVSKDDVSIFINDIPATRRHGADNYLNSGTLGFYVSKDCKVAFDNIKIDQTTVNYSYEDGDTVYSEDFSETTIDALNYGSTGSVSDMKIVDGKLNITAGTADAWVTLPDTFDTAMDTFTYEAELTNVSLPAATYHNGIVYRFGSTANFERASLRANGESNLASQLNGEWVTASKNSGSVFSKNLTSSGLDIGNDEIPLNITYKLRVEVTPDETRFYVNGINAGVRKAVDSKISSGSLGFYISKNCSVLIDNIKVTYGVDPIESFDYEKDEVVFSEDFSEVATDNLKFTATGTGASMAVTDGRLVVTSGSADAWISIPEGYDKSMDAFVFEAEMTNISLPAAGYHNGLVYRFGSAANFERATLRANGEALVHSQIGGKWVGASKNGGSLIAKNLATSLDLDKLGEGDIPLNITYKLRVEVNEEETRYYVNDVYAGVRTAADSQMDSGSIGFYVSKNCTVAFDNIKVTYGKVEFELGIEEITGNSSPEGETGTAITEEKQNFEQTKPQATEETSSGEDDSGNSLDGKLVIFIVIGIIAVVVISAVTVTIIIVKRKKEKKND